MIFILAVLTVLKASIREREIAQSCEPSLGSMKSTSCTLSIVVLSFRRRTNVSGPTDTSGYRCVCRDNGTSLPDARACKLDLLVPRSLRIARNSSYFLLIWKFRSCPQPSSSFCPPNFLISISDSSFTNFLAVFMKNISS